MTSTRDPQEPTPVTTDPAATDDTAGFTAINTTRSNIPSKPSQHALGVIPSLGLGGGLTPSLEPPALLGADVAGFVASDPDANDQPAVTDDTAGYNLVNTTRSNIKASGSVVSPLGLGGGLTPSLGLPPLGEHDVAGFVVPDPDAGEQPNDATPDPDDTAGFGDPVPGVDFKLGQNLGGLSGKSVALGLGGGLTPSFGLAAPAGHDVAGFVAPDAPASEPPAEDTDDTDDTAGFGLGFGLLGGTPAASLGTAPKPGDPGGPLINRPGSPFPG
jgi:hypothetical protein